MADIRIENVPALGEPLGPYSHLARVRGARETVYIAGMVCEGATFEAQCEGVYEAIAKALAAVGASWPHVVQFTTYLVHSQDIARFMAWRRERYTRLFPDGRYPPNTLLVVDRLVREDYLIEVQTIAAL